MPIQHDLHHTRHQAMNETRDALLYHCFEAFAGLQLSGNRHMTQLRDTIALS